MADPLTITQAIDRLRTLPKAAASVDVAGWNDDELDRLLSVVRVGQRELDHLVVRIAEAAEGRVESGGRGATGVLLGDGSQVSGRTARREAQRAAVLGHLGVVAEAAAAGRIGAAQVDAFASAAGSLDEEQRRSLDRSDLVDDAEALPVDTFARRLRAEVERIKGDHGRADAVAKRQASTWRMWFDDRTGMGHVKGEFDPERFEAIEQSVQAHLARLANGGGVTKGHNLAASAAYELLTGASPRSGSGGVPHVNVVVDWETFTRGAHDVSVRETAGGHRLAPESIARLACDAIIQRIVLDERGVPVNVGRRYRTATDAQWQAVRAIHRSCAWIGCDRPLAWCQLHHIHEWEHGGSTDLCNLIPLCSRHHHEVHEGGWSVRLHEDRRLEVIDPSGVVIGSAKPDRVHDVMRC